MTVRLSDQLGLEKISKMSLKLGVYENFPNLISSSLGSLESTLQKITAAYATIANGGYKVEANLIDVIYDSDGKVLYKADKRQCLDCMVDKSLHSNPSELEKIAIPKIKNNSQKSFFQRNQLIK